MEVCGLNLKPEVIFEYIERENESEIQIEKERRRERARNNERENKKYRQIYRERVREREGESETERERDKERGSEKDISSICRFPRLIRDPHWGTWANNRIHKDALLIWVEWAIAIPILVTLRSFCVFF